MAKKKSLTVKEYERLGRTLESIFEGGYVEHNRIYKINLIRGVFFGLGAAIGGTFVVACLVWILTLVGEVPFIGDFVDIIKNSLDAR